MAIYHLSAKAISRGKGQSVVAAAAYRAGDKLQDERTGELKDYSRRDGVAFEGIFAPKDAPDWAKDREQLWNAVEANETRKNSRLAREIEINLPYELTPDQRRYLVQDFVKENITRKGLVADVAIHEPSKQGDQRNYHAHILFTTRAITPDGFVKDKLRELDKKESLEQWRESWERHANRHLERHGHAERISCKSHEALGIAQEPSIKLGEATTHLERQGIRTERGDINRAITERNQQREALRREGQVIDIGLQREQQHDEWEKARAAKLGATLYDRGDMVSQQQDALTHHQERQALKQAAAEREEQRQAQPTKTAADRWKETQDRLRSEWQQGRETSDRRQRQEHRHERQKTESDREREEQERSGRENGGRERER